MKINFGEFSKQLQHLDWHCCTFFVLLLFFVNIASGDYTLYYPYYCSGIAPHRLETIMDSDRVLVGSE